MLSTPRKVSNSSPAFPVPGCSRALGTCGAASASASFVKGSQLRGRQPRLCRENCLAKLEATPKITVTTGGERQARSFSPPCLPGAVDSTLLPSFSLFLWHSPFPGRLGGSFTRQPGKENRLKPWLRKQREERFRSGARNRPPLLPRRRRCPCAPRARRRGRRPGSGGCRGGGGLPLPRRWEAEPRGGAD